MLSYASPTAVEAVSIRRLPIFVRLSTPPPPSGATEDRIERLLAALQEKDHRLHTRLAFLSFSRTALRRALPGDHADAEERRLSEAIARMGYLSGGLREIRRNVLAHQALLRVYAAQGDPHPPPQFIALIDRAEAQMETLAGLFVHFV